MALSWMNTNKKNIYMDLNFTGIITAVVTFLIIGLFHPLVIKGEYYFGTKIWWWFGVFGILFLVASLVVNSMILSIIAGVIGCSCLWSILEVFEQRERVRKGWFPTHPKHAEQYRLEDEELKKKKKK
jgi:uncharacterized membrane protein YuzA (DUF378 family)